MLAGRKLLLADDSLTIQKIVALTFADEGVEVVTASDGQEAIEKLKEGAPDIVLADTFMPVMNGYEVCQYIKQDAKLKHIPVMLLVGSFEPFDEAEARRVGANEILTKPFQSIRRLINKVGGLVTGKTAEDEVPTADLPTAELPHVDEKPAEPEKLSTEELEITTADTQRLPMVEKMPEVATVPAAVSEQTSPAETSKPRDNQRMDNISPTWESESSLDASEVLLDLGDVGQSYETLADEFVLDIDLAEVEPVGALEGSLLSKPQPFVEPKLSEPSVVGWEVKVEEPAIEPAGRDTSELSESQLAATQEWPRPETAPAVDISSEAVGTEIEAVALERVVDEPQEPEPVAASTGQIGVDQLSSEVMDAIARRAVEMLSEKVVQEIAWEVVPQLAELLIKRKLEEKESQH